MYIQPEVGVRRGDNTFLTRSLREGGSFDLWVRMVFAQCFLGGAEREVRVGRGFWRVFNGFGSVDFWNK